MSGPLSGIKVIDFTHVLAGPACSHFLGLLGADVIKVEGVARGDGMRYRGGTDRDAQARGMSTAYLAQGAGKRAIALDLETEAGQKIMARLLETADVFVENHLPDTMRGFGLDEASLRTAHPHLIHCAMTGYGRGGDMENAPAYDVNIQAACGIMTMTGTADTGPLRTGAPIMDYGVAMAAGFAISSALYQREKTGEGCFIDVSMLETGLTLMTSAVADFLATGNAPEPRGNAANSRSPGAGSFPCAQGVLSLGVNEEPQFRRLAVALGREDWLTDPRFDTRAHRQTHAKALEDELSRVLLTRTAEDWEARLLAQQVPAARLRSLPECLAMPQVAARQFLRETPNGASGATLPFRFGQAPAYALDRDAPEHAQDTEAILAQTGFTRNEISEFLEQGAVAQG